MEAPSQIHGAPSPSAVIEINPTSNCRMAQRGKQYSSWPEDGRIESTNKSRMMGLGTTLGILVFAQGCVQHLQCKSASPWREISSQMFAQNSEGANLDRPPQTSRHACRSARGSLGAHPGDCVAESHWPDRRSDAPDLRTEPSKRESSVSEVAMLHSQPYALIRQPWR